MRSFSGTYPYLTGCLIALGVFLTVLALSGRRRPILLSAILAVPHALFALFLVPQYWRPKLIVSLPVGLEDFLFMFICGGMAWVEASWLFRRRLALDLRPAGMASRLLGPVAFSIGAFGVFLGLGFRNMMVPLGIMASWIVLLLVLRRRLWPLIAAAAVQSFLIYSLTLIVMRAFSPGFFSAWTWSNLSGPSLWGVPLEEFAWGLAYGPFWGTTMAYVFDAKWIPLDMEKSR